MAPYRTVLFDLDGTLIDSIRLILDSYRHTLARHGLPPRPDDFWLSGIGTPLRAQFAQCMDEAEMVDILVETYREYNMLHHDRMVRPYPGIVRVIQHLRRRRVGIGLVTSKSRQGAMRGLEVSGLTALVDVIVGADDVERAKPHPEPVERALHALAADPTQTVFVGDSIHDMHAGRAAGVATAAVLWGPFTRDQLAPTTPDHWLERPGDLLPIVTRST